MTDGSEGMEKERHDLRQEAKEFVLIFNAILKKKSCPACRWEIPGPTIQSTPNSQILALELFGSCDLEFVISFFGSCDLRFVIYSLVLVI